MSATSTLKLFLFALLGMVPGLTAQASPGCAAISCDCTSLPSATWVKMCEKQEKTLQNQCKKKTLEKTGYCSVHGPKATRITLSLDTEKTSKEQTNIIKLVGYKSTAVLWSMNKDLEFIAHKIDSGEFATIEQRLRLLELNADTHFNTQKQLVQLLNESSNTSEINKTWHSYSADTESIASQLVAQGNRLRAAIKDADEAKQLGNELLKSAGGLYEQVGYAYAQTKSHKESAQGWKQAATIASELLQFAKQEGNNEDAEYFRYQAATRFHRASQNWSLGKESKQAQSALEASQKYMGEE